MTLEQIIDKLKEHPDLALQVDGRIHPIGLPAGTPFPAITYEVIVGRQVTSKDGPRKLRTVTLRFTVWSEQQTQGRTIASSAVLGRAMQWLRSVGAIHNAIPGAPSDDVFPDPFAWLTILTYVIWWKE